MLEIHLLGTPEVLLDQAPLPLARRKTRALLYYLAAHTQPLSREHLLNLFWPDAPRASAQQVLRTTVHSLRQSLGSWLVSDDDSLALGAEADVDSRRFEDALTGPSAGIPDLQEALALYRGDFLAEFSLSGSPGFDDWQTVERERFSRLALRGLEQLAGAFTLQQDYASALSSLERALSMDPLQEDLQREAMRLEYLLGDRPAAVRRYDALRRLLDDEMGVPPMSETRALYDAVLNDKISPAQPGPGGIAVQPRSRGPAHPPLGSAQADQLLPFTGRQAELALLARAAEEHKVALLEGEPGIGKTRLAAEALRLSGTLALAGAARELEQAIPYQPVIEALRGLTSRPDWPLLLTGLQTRVSPVWLAEAATLVPELDPAHPPRRQPTEESRLWEAVSQVIQAFSAERPAALFIDDLQWADASTLGLLAYLVRQAGTAPVRFLAATRPVLPRSPVATLIQNLTREGRLVRLSLSRLSAEEITAIARKLSEMYAYPLAHWLQEASEGNPYVLAELIRYAREHGLLLPGGEVNLNELSATTILPQTVYTLIQSRLARLSETARRLLEAAVASGREFEFDVAARAAGLSETAALEALSELHQSGLIHPADGARYTFDHSLTLEVANREVGEPRHRLLHRRVAEAMETVYHGSQLDQAAGLIAWHYNEGRAPDRAAPFALRAARQAARLAAWAEAAAFFEQAAASNSPQDRYQAFLGLGRARMQSGQEAAASDAFRQAVRLVRDDPRAGRWEEADLELAGSYITQARYDELVRLVRKVREQGQAEYHPQAEFMWGTGLSLEGADLDGAAEHLTAAESLCALNPNRDPTLRSRIQFELGGVAAQRGDLPAAVERYRRALDQACQSQDELTLGWCALAHNNLAYHLLLMGDLAAAEEHARQGLALASDKGMLTQLTYLFSTSGEIALARGDADAAETSFLQGLELAGRLGMAERIAGLTANLGLVAQKRGQASLAVHRLSTALARADAARTQHLAAQIRIWLAPLLPPGESRRTLAEARAFAEQGQRRLLLEQIDQLEKSGENP